MGHTRRCLEGVGPEGGSTPPTSTTILGTLEPSKTARVPVSQKSPVFGAFFVIPPGRYRNSPLALSADVLYSWRNPYLLFGCRPKRKPLILLGKTRFLYSAALFGMSSMREIGQAFAHSGKATIPLDMSHPPASFQCNSAVGIVLTSTFLFDGQIIA